ncbi:MAG: hypothetical protein QM756_22780 [Polyangiaceae bacterium]
MGSFAALYIEASLGAAKALVEPWAHALGFGAAEAFDEPPRALGGFFIATKALGLVEHGNGWSQLAIQGFRMPRGGEVGLTTVEPLALLCPRRALLFVAQTTSDVYELGLFEAGRRLRYLSHADGQRLEDEGARLASETCDTFGSIGERPEEDERGPFDDAQEIAKALGVDLWADNRRGAGFLWRRRHFLSRWFS